MSDDYKVLINRIKQEKLKLFLTLSVPRANSSILFGTDFRLFSEKILKTISSYLHIDFSKNMIYFNDSNHSGGGKFNLDNEQPNGRDWYDKVSSSKEIMKPKKKPLSTDKFPKFLQKYLLKLQSLYILDMPMIKKN